MKIFTKSMEPDASLGLAERASYMLGNAGTALINTVIATFLMFFYTDVMMLNPGIIGMILLASRIFDGITDIIMGMIVDRTKSKHGKARVWILRMFIPFAISGFLLVCVPGGSTTIVQYIYVFLTYNICNALFLTALYVPYNAMMCNITSNPYERGILGIFVLFGAVIGTMAVQSTVDMATKALGGDQRAWQIVIGIYALAGLLLHLICFLGTKERCVSLIQDGDKLHMKDEMKSLFTNKYWMLAVATTLVVMFFTAFTGSAGLYYSKGVFGDTSYYASIANAMSISQVLALFVSFVPMKKYGKKITIMIGLLFLAIGTGIQCVLGDHISILIFCSILKGLGAGFSAGSAYGLVADTIDYGEWKTGTKAEGVGMAALTFVTKISAGFAGAIIGWVNDVSGYNATATLQSTSAIIGLKICFSYLPFICCILGIICLSFYDLDKIFPKIQEDLKLRREAKVKR